MSRALKTLKLFGIYGVSSCRKITIVLTNVLEPYTCVEILQKY
jgi:hypothetical protein